MKAIMFRSRPMRIKISGQPFAYKPCVSKFSTTKAQLYHLKMDAMIPIFRGLLQELN